MAEGYKLLVLDVDGVMTDGSIYITDSGEEVKAFNSKDGHGIKLLMRAGLEVAIITGRVSKALEHRVNDLGIQHVVQNCKDKRAALNDLADELGLPTNQMVFIGDDVVDLPAMRLCGLSFAPADALPMVKREAGIVTECLGGRGCVREAIEEILRRVGKFDEVMARYVE